MNQMDGEEKSLSNFFKLDVPKIKKIISTKETKW
jgi:hypothetical protein